MFWMGLLRTHSIHRLDSLCPLDGLANIVFDANDFLRYGPYDIDDLFTTIHWDPRGCRKPTLALLDDLYRNLMPC